MEIEAADCAASIVRKQEMNTGLGLLSLFDPVPTPWDGVHIRTGGLHLVEPPWKPTCVSKCNPTDDNSPSLTEWRTSGLKGKAVLIQMPETKGPSEESSAAGHTHSVGHRPWDSRGRKSRGKVG